MDEERAEKVCEKSTTQEGNSLEILNSLLIVLYNTIYSYKEYINSNKCISAESFAEGFFRSQKLKYRRKRGPAKKPTKDYSEINKVREEMFVKFWTKYPRKQAQASTLKIWLRIPGLEPIFPSIMEALEWQIREWEGGKYAPAPAKYLLDRRWEDQPRAKKQAANKGAFGDLDYEFPSN